MAVGEIMLQQTLQCSQQQHHSHVSLTRRNMAWNSGGGNKLPKLVVDLATKQQKPCKTTTTTTTPSTASGHSDIIGRTLASPGHHTTLIPSQGKVSRTAEPRALISAPAVGAGGMQKVCGRSCSCDNLYSSSSSGSTNNAAAADSGFSDEEMLGSGGSDSTGHTPSPLGFHYEGPCFMNKQGQAFVRLLSPPAVCRRSNSSDSTTSGCESPVPNCFHHDDDREDCSSGSGSGGNTPGVHEKLPNSNFTSDQDLKILNQTKDRLLDSGFYYSSMTMSEAKRKLKGQAVGTFILRDSYHPGFLFTLSTRTARGTTSVRIAYSGGYFRLDCDDHLSSHMPRFDCILRLIQYYILASKRRSSKCVWIESTGRKDTPVQLSNPLRQAVSSLKHLSRRAIHNIVPNEKLVQLPIKPDQLSYLMEYPYSV